MSRIRDNIQTALNIQILMYSDVKIGEVSGSVSAAPTHQHGRYSAVAVVMRI